MVLLLLGIWLSVCVGVCKGVILNGVFVCRALLCRIGGHEVMP